MAPSQSPSIKAFGVCCLSVVISFSNYGYYESMFNLGMETSGGILSMHQPDHCDSSFLVYNNNSLNFHFEISILATSKVLKWLLIRENLTLQWAVDRSVVRNAKYNWGCEELANIQNNSRSPHSLVLGLWHFTISSVVCLLELSEVDRKKLMQQ